jgi:DNA repair protein RadD
MSFKSFPLHRLENLIGEETLSKIANILPAFDSNVDVDNIYTKNNLVKIVYSFFDSTEFSKKELRKEFLSFQNNERINSFCKIVGLSINDSFDEKINKIVSRGWSNLDFCKLFCDFFELPTQFIPQEERKYPNTEYVLKSNSPFKLLKDYQSVISFKAINNLKYRNKKFIIQMPTGSGKTRTAMEIISDCFIRNNEKCIIYWLVYSEELCDQAVECFVDVWSHVGNKDVKLVRAWGANNLILSSEDKFAFVVGGFQKLFNQLQKYPNYFESLKNETFLIVVDEAHRVLAPTYHKVTDALFGVNSRLIGLTATPGRGLNDNDENFKLSNFFNSDKITIETPDEITVFSYLKSKGIMANVNYIPLVTSPTFSLTSKELKYLEENFDFPPGLISKIGEDETRNFEILNELINKLKTHKKALFFACSINHSKFICSVLNYLGIKASHVDGSTNKGARQYMLEDFKSGDLQIICNYGILSTGFDAPKTDLVFISRPTQSIVLYSQMIGRGLRGKEVGGTENCTIVTVKDNILGLPNESNIFTFFDDYFES